MRYVGRRCYRDNVDLSIRNLTRIGSVGMNETDKVVLDIMTHKSCEY